MNIVYLSSSSLPSRKANSVHVMKMCQALAKANHNVTLFGINNTDPDLGDDIYSYYGVEKCFDITKIRLLNIKGATLFYSLYAALLAKRQKPDIAYCRDLLGCYFFSLISDSKIILESHSPYSQEGKISNLLFRSLLMQKKFQRLIVITKSLERYYLLNYPYLQGKIITAPDGADFPLKASCKPSSKSVQTAGFFNVGYFGSLYPGKGMEIIERLSQVCNRVKFHVFGGTKSDFERWKLKLEKQTNVHLYGFIPHGEIANHYEIMDALIAPFGKLVTLTDGRGNITEWTSPLKIFEYMASRKPIICSNLPVLREILTNETNCLLCDPDNISEWENAIQRLATNPLLGRKLAMNALDDLKSRYTWDIRARNVLFDI